MTFFLLITSSLRHCFPQKQVMTFFLLISFTSRSFFGNFSSFFILNCKFALHSLKIVSKFLEKSPKQKSQGLRKKSQGPKVRSKVPRSWDMSQGVVTL